MCVFPKWKETTGNMYHPLSCSKFETIKNKTKIIVWGLAHNLECLQRTDWMILLIFLGSYSGCRTRQPMNLVASKLSQNSLPYQEGRSLCDFRHDGKEASTHFCGSVIKSPNLCLMFADGCQTLPVPFSFLLVRPVESPGAPFFGTGRIVPTPPTPPPPPRAMHAHTKSHPVWPLTPIKARTIHSSWL